MKTQVHRFALRQRVRIAHDLAVVLGDDAVTARKNVQRIQMGEITFEPVERLFALIQIHSGRTLQSLLQHREPLLLAVESCIKSRHARRVQLQLRHAPLVQPAHCADQTLPMLAQLYLPTTQLIGGVHHHACKMIEALRVRMGDACDAARKPRVLTLQRLQ